MIRVLLLIGMILALLVALGAVATATMTSASNLMLSGSLTLLVVALIGSFVLCLIVAVRAYALGRASVKVQSDEALAEMQRRLERARAHAPKQIAPMPFVMLAPPQQPTMQLPSGDDKPKRAVVRRARRSAASSVAKGMFR